MVTASDPRKTAARTTLATLGERLRRERKHQKVTAVAASEAAHISRVTLHRIERGEPSVAMGAWIALAEALGLSFDVIDPRATTRSTALPKRIRLADYPQLKKIGWQLRKDTTLTPAEALALYERNWRHVDADGFTEPERALVRALSAQLGGGRLLV